MFSLSFIALERLSQNLNPEIIKKTHMLLAQTCLALTKGQHLDISFESNDNVTVQSYLQMIQGKTATLLATATQLGALIAGADQDSVEAYRQLGFNLGIAFQIQDDFLGIWGDQEFTGKSTASDLIARKKSLPILYGLQQQGKFARAWQQEKITEVNAPKLAKMLENEGALDYTKERAEYYTSRAMEIFQPKRIENPAVTALEELFDKLLKRTA
jgi:geranylgeranyl diphosphate synthase type I